MSACCDISCVATTWGHVGSQARAAFQGLEARDGNATFSLSRPGTRSSGPAGLVLHTIFHRPRCISIQMGRQGVGPVSQVITLRQTQGRRFERLECSWHSPVGCSGDARGWEGGGAPSFVAGPGKAHRLGSHRDGAPAFHGAGLNCPEIPR